MIQLLSLYFLNFYNLYALYFLRNTECIIYRLLLKTYIFFLIRVHKAKFVEEVL